MRKELIRSTLNSAIISVPASFIEEFTPGELSAFVTKIDATRLDLINTDVRKYNDIMCFSIDLGKRLK
jgi:hypothetical protein